MADLGCSCTSDFHNKGLRPHLVVPADLLISYLSHNDEIIYANSAIRSKTATDSMKFSLVSLTAPI
ncbi:MAG: hypothetical protein CMJ63_00475 [Planctomycetaceae bacterium]|nr:hypothetical protein [Planctomycetaceae bacterium]